MIWKPELQMRERERIKILHLLLYSPMAAVARAGPGQSRSLKLCLGLPHGWQGARHLGNLPLLSHYQKARPKVEQAWFQVVPFWVSVLQEQSTPGLQHQSYTSVSHDILQSQLCISISTTVHNRWKVEASQVSLAGKYTVGPIKYYSASKMNKVFNVL